MRSLPAVIQRRAGAIARLTLCLLSIQTLVLHAAGQAAAQPPAAGVRINLSSDTHFLLKGVRLVGSSVLDQPAVDHAVAPFAGRSIGFGDVEEIRRRLTLLYVDRGYINSGVVVPNQTIADGVLTLQAVEGRLTGIEVTGNRHYRSSYLVDRLQRGVSVPFNVNDLGRQQQILLQDPLLRRLNLSIQPGLRPGEARVLGDVLEASPYSLNVQVANSQSPTVGEVRGQLQGMVATARGVGPRLLGQSGRPPGTNPGAVGYSLPIASDDTRLSLRYDINDALVIAQSVGPLNITSRYQSIALGLSRPFYRSAEQALVMGLSLEWRRDQTFLLGQPFSFTAGSDNGRTNVTVLRFYQDWLDRNAERVLAARSTFSFGIDALGATVTSTPPTGRFFDWLGQAQYVRRVFGNWEVLVRGVLQLSNDPLFPVEQFVLGGISTVRGYREYLTATDNAAVGTVELRVPVGRIPLPLLSNAVDAGVVQLAPFYDNGIGWNTGRATPLNFDLSSIGIGLRWLIGSGTAAELYYGHALHRARLGNSLQDKGVSFRIVAGVF